MVRPSLDIHMVYVAVDLDTALAAALKRQESELCEIKRRRQKLEELAKQQRLGPNAR